MIILPLTPNELKRTSTPELLALMTIARGSIHFKYLLLELNRRYGPEILPSKERIKAILDSTMQQSVQNCIEQVEVDSIVSDFRWLYGILGL